MVMPLSCIPTSKVQLECFEFNTFLISVDSQRCFFVKGGSTEGHTDVGQLQSTSGKVHRCVCEPGQLPPLSWVHPQGEDERRGPGRDEKGSHLATDSRLMLTEDNLKTGLCKCCLCVFQLTDGVVDIIMYPSSTDKSKNRGFAFVEYKSHKAAAMARRKLIPGTYLSST